MSAGWSSEQYDTVADRSNPAGIAVRVPLIAPEHNDVVRLELEALAARREDERAGLAGEIFPRAGGVRNADEACAR